MRYYTERGSIKDRLADDEAKVVAHCFDVLKAEEICFYLNEVEFDKKKEMR